MLIFAAISPHPPLILPSVGSGTDRAQVADTIENLRNLGEKLKEKRPDKILISSPHPEWGFNVPLFFLAKDFKGEIKTYLMGVREPKYYFEQGKEIYNSEVKGLNHHPRVALIASGDLSHCLKEEGPYGFHPDGPKFDKTLIEKLKEKDIGGILELNEQFPNAAECGLRSFCFILGILQASKIKWEPEILSYEGPFGVGYLVADFKLENA